MLAARATGAREDTARTTTHPISAASTAPTARLDGLLRLIITWQKRLHDNREHRVFPAPKRIRGDDHGNTAPRLARGTRDGCTEMCSGQDWRRRRRARGGGLPARDRRDMQLTRRAVGSQPFTPADVQGFDVDTLQDSLRDQHLARLARVAERGLRC